MRIKRWQDQRYLMNRGFKVTSAVGRSVVNGNNVFQNNEQFNDEKKISHPSRRELLQNIMNMVIMSSSAVSEAQATMTDPKRGIVFPSVGEIESAIPPVWDVENPYSEKSQSSPSFARLDNTPDSIFYQEPRFVEHIDETTTVPLLTQYISQELAMIPKSSKNPAILDLGASWTSHIDMTNVVSNSRITGIGMNAQELQSNKALTDWEVVDLNIDGATLPRDNDTYDLVLCQLSIDYFIHPLQVMKEVSRVLKPGGRVAILFSNRLFLQKAVGIWTGADDIDHAYFVGSYLHYCNGNFENIVARDLSLRNKKNNMVVSDPLYVVTANKQQIFI